MSYKVYYTLIYILTKKKVSLFLCVLQITSTSFPEYSSEPGGIHREEFFYMYIGLLSWRLVPGKGQRWREQKPNWLR